ncbi:AlpA family transcriptional regulator [Parasphingorhabdus sp. JC815]|uniref:helix-turn-helix transcriptional regulator n=1 Tax=Parasphingorhabdus sp. JC815 TaxID=3232140 RepID=UPI003458AB1F
MPEPSIQIQDRSSAARLIRLTEVQKRVGLGRSTIYRWMSDNRFPKPYQLGGHAVAWLEQEIDEWIAQRIAPHD